MIVSLNTDCATPDMSNSIGVVHHRDVVDVSPAPKIMKVAKDDDEPLTVAKKAALLQEAIADGLTDAFWNDRGDGDFADDYGDKFEFDAGKLTVKIIGSDETAMFALKFVKASGDPVHGNEVKPASNDAKLSELNSMLYAEVEQHLFEGIWYQNGEEYEEVIGGGFEMVEDSLRVTITGTDGKETYDVKLVKIEEQVKPKKTKKTKGAKKSE